MIVLRLSIFCIHLYTAVLLSASSHSNIKVMRHSVSLAADASSAGAALLEEEQQRPSK